MGATTDIRLRWVLADPARERAVDALGMGVQADRLADLLLPQLSSTTTRARYFSFLCWAVHKSRGTSARTLAIHRLEAELAIEEATGHRDDAAGACPDVVGRSRAALYLRDHQGKPPVRPERLYKSTAFATYRPAMRALGLLARSRSPDLTKDGERLAAAFERARGPKPRCLSDMSSAEQVQLRVLLGLDGRQRTNRGDACARRRATFDEVAGALGRGFDAAAVLEEHARVGARPTAVAAVLHRAFVWELLSCGLALAFSMLLDQGRGKPLARALKRSLAGRPRRPMLGPLVANGLDSAMDVVALLRAATQCRPDDLGLDPGPTRIASRLVSDRDPDVFLRQLVQRHRLAKPDGPWIGLAGDKVQILAPAKSLAFDVRHRSYRLNAFAQLLRDLEMIG